MNLEAQVMSAPLHFRQQRMGYHPSGGLSLIINHYEKSIVPDLDDSRAGV